MKSEKYVWMIVWMAIIGVLVVFGFILLQDQEVRALNAGSPGNAAQFSTLKYTTIGAGVGVEVLILLWGLKMKLAERPKIERIKLRVAEGPKPERIKLRVAELGRKEKERRVKLRVVEPGKKEKKHRIKLRVAEPTQAEKKRRTK